MEDIGMTDLQFKSFLRQLVGRLEAVRGTCPQSDKQATKIYQQLNDIIADLQSDIES